MTKCQTPHPYSSTYGRCVGMSFDDLHFTKNGAHMQKYVLNYTEENKI